jgi:hypothetical protein
MSNIFDTIMTDNSFVDPYATTVTTSNNTTGVSLNRPMTDTDKTTTLYKKFLGYPNTIADPAINIEYNYPVNPISFSSQVTIDPIPTVLDQNLQTDLNTIRNAAWDSSLKKISSQIPSVSNFTVTGFGAGLRCKLKTTYDHITYYRRILLRPTPIGAGKAFMFHEDSKFNVLSGAIPSTFASNYDTFKIELECVKGTTLSPISVNDYVFDRDAGIITIYNANLYGIDGKNPPYVSFWRYEGRYLNSIQFSGNQIGVQGKDGLPGINGKDGSDITAATPAPTLSSSSSTPTSITLQLTPPVQKKVTFTDAYFPSINNVTIVVTMFDAGNNAINFDGTNTATQSFPVSIPINQKVRSSLVIHNLSGSNGNTPNSINIFLGRTYENLRKMNVTIRYNSFSEEPSTPLDISGLELSAPLAPGKPKSVSFTTIATTTFSVNITSPDSTVGMPIKSYEYIAKPISTSRNGGLFNETVISGSIAGLNINADNVLTPGNISGLLPGTRYDISFNAVNTYNLNGPIFDISGTTSLPAIRANPYVNNKSILITSDYASGLNVDDTPVFTKGTIKNFTLSNVYIKNHPSVTLSLLSFGIELNMSSTPINLNSLPGQTQSFTNNGITITINNIRDPELNASSGFYKICDMDVSLDTTNFTAQSTVHTIEIKQIIGQAINNSLTYTRSYQFYTSDIITDSNPTLSADISATGGASGTICGIPIYDKAWQISVSNISGTNFTSPILPSTLMRYSYFGSSGIVTQYTSYNVTNFNMTGNSSSDYHQGSDFVLTIYNINKDTRNNTGTRTVRINRIIDKASLTLNTPRMSIPDTFSTFSGFRSTFDNVDITGNKQLLISDGKFVTSLSEKYIDYTLYGGPNYSSIALETGYRYAAFRWNLSGDLSPNGITFTVNGLTGITLDKPNFSIITANSKPLELYYRIEDIDISGGDPTNKTNAQTLQEYSSVWVTLVGGSKNDNFGAQYSITDNNLTLAGYDQSSFNGSYIVKYNGSDIVEYNVKYENNTLTLKNFTTVGITGKSNVRVYFMIGLPMDTNVSFTNVSFAKK